MLKNADKIKPLLFFSEQPGATSVSVFTLSHRARHGRYSQVRIADRIL